MRRSVEAPWFFSEQNMFRLAGIMLGILIMALISALLAWTLGASTLAIARTSIIVFAASSLRLVHFFDAGARVPRILRSLESTAACGLVFSMAVFASYLFFREAQAVISLTPTTVQKPAVEGHAPKAKEPRRAPLTVNSVIQKETHKLSEYATKAGEIALCLFFDAKTTLSKRTALVEAAGHFQKAISYKNEPLDSQYLQAMIKQVQRHLSNLDRTVQ